MTYAGVGVDYDTMDPLKLMAQLAAQETSENLIRFGFSEVEWSRGESCYVVDIRDAYIGHVEEGLGTKNIVADMFHELVQIAETIKHDSSYYDFIAQCTLATIVNDMITLGVLPFSVAMHLVAGTPDWFSNEKRYRDLVEGWKYACMLAQCAWGGGETATLKDLIMPGRVVLSGSAVGIAKPKERLIVPNVQHDDAIVLIESSGIHANGLTMARAIADKLQDGYLTILDDGRTYGETLLDPTHIYVPLVEDCLDNDVNIHYIVNLTGHGWRKLMRANTKQPFAYVIEQLPTQLPVFPFLQKHGPIDDREAFGNLNMGAGLALYVPQSDVDMVLKIADENLLRAIHAGHVEKSEGKKVVIKPKGLEYLGPTLSVR